MPRKKKYQGQKPLPNLESQLEDEAAKNERPLGMPPLEMVKDYGASLGLTEQDAEHIYDTWLANGFTLKRGTRVRNWKAAMRVWQRNDWFPSQKKARQNLNAMEAKQEQLRKAAIQRMKEKKDES